MSVKPREMKEVFFETGSIFMLHRIAPYEGGRIIYNEEMKVSPEDLILAIKRLREKKRVFVSLDELCDRAKKGRTDDHKFAAITIDDGYRDNMDFAWPIFKELNVPFCIYVTNCFPQRTASLWWYALEELVMINETLKGEDGTLDNSSIDLKQANFLAIRSQVLTRHFANPMAYLHGLGRLEFDIDKERAEKCLTWDEIVSMSADPLVTIGAHTLNHFPLAQLEAKAALHEIQESKIQLEQRLKRPVHHFAFPFGGKGEAGLREYDMVRDAGFRSAVTTVHGHVYSQDNLLQLKRLFLPPLRGNPTKLDDLMRKRPRDFVKNALNILNR